MHRWKADRQVGHPVILAGPAQMIGRAFYSTTASTDDIYLWICCQSISDIHCYQDVKSIPWNITTSVSPAGFSNLPTLPLRRQITSPGSIGHRGKVSMWEHPEVGSLCFHLIVLQVIVRADQNHLIISC